MEGRKAARADTWAIGPLGERLTLDMLPPPGTRRWVIRRKAEVVCAVEGKLITLHEVIKRYNISPDEYVAWREAVARHGMRGLRLTKLQDYRERERRFLD